MYAVGVTATVLVLVGLETLSHCFKSIGMRNMIIEFSVTDGNVLKEVTSKFASSGYQLSSYEMNEEAQGCFRVTMVIKARRMNEEGVLLMLLHDFPELTVNRIV